MHRNIVKIQIYCSINLRGVTAKLLIYSNRSWKSEIIKTLIAIPTLTYVRYLISFVLKIAS